MNKNEQQKTRRPVMRNLVLVVLALIGIWYGVTASAVQLPVPSALLEHRTIFLTGQNIERGWLNWAAEEIHKLDRFELVGDREDAELVFTIIHTESDEGTAVLPLTGGGTISVPLEQQGVTLFVHDQNDQLLWNDSREINWLASGAVKDLIRDLHKAINQNEQEKR